MNSPKVIILAGGLGTRLSDEENRIPKPLTTIGNIPMLEHIMNIYSHYNFNEFVICLGYKGNLIKEYFANYYLNNCNLSINLKENSIRYRYENRKEWMIDLINTGLNTATASRIKKIKNYVENRTAFLTYGDGLSDIDINKLLEFHKSHGKLITVTTTQSRSRFGVVELNEDNFIINFNEKPKDTNSYINAGFFVIEPEIFNYIKDDDNQWWESDVLPELVKNRQVMAYVHKGNFKPLDSPKDKNELEELWNSGKAFWRK